MPIIDAHFIGNVRDGATGPGPIDQESLAAHLGWVWGWDLYRETLARAVADHLAIETGERVVCRCEYFRSSVGVSCRLVPPSGRVRTQRPVWCEGREDGWVLSRAWGLTHDMFDRSVLISRCRLLAGDGALSVPGWRGVSR